MDTPRHPSRDPDVAGRRTLVLGLGNPILSDDAVGVRVAEAVRAALPADTPVVVEEASLGGLSLMERMVGYDRVLLIDASTAGLGPPGSLHRLELADLRAMGPTTEHSCSVHDATLPTALDLGRRMGLDLPYDLTVFAVEVENVTDFGEEPTPKVRHAIPQVVAAVLAELDRDRIA